MVSNSAAASSRVAMPSEKTILFLTTTFYPDPVVAAVRLTQWCRHLPEFEWKPTVLCRYYGHFATQDEIEAHVHPEVRVHYFNMPSLPKRSSTESGLATTSQRPPGIWQRVRASNAFRFSTNQLSEALFVPDVSIRFWRRARSQALAMVDQLQPAVVLTSSPPHSNHDIGRWLVMQRPNLKWIADFRDPYLIDTRYGPRRTRYLKTRAHRTFERSIYEHADLVTHAIPIQARWARMQYPHERGKIKILTNGCPSLLTDSPMEPVPAETGRTSIRVMGATDPRQRAQLARVVQRLIDAGNDVDLCLIGKCHRDDQRLESQLNSRFLATGQLPHHDAVQYLLGAGILVAELEEHRRHFMGISSKLFEFLACGRPIVVVNPTRPDRQLMKRFAGVRSATRPTDEELYELLRWALTNDAQPPREQANRVREEFSRRAQVKTLAGWLDQIAISETRSGTVQYE